MRYKLKCPICGESIWVNGSYEPDTNATVLDDDAIELSEACEHIQDDCKGVKGIVCAGWSELDTRKIYIQAAMTWTPQLLLIAVEHEYGHMLMGSAHSLDPNSVMFSIVHEGQHIQADDRMWAGKLDERTTILRKD